MTAGRSFTARYRGYCRECGSVIEPGDPITYVEDYPSPVHADCADAPEPKPATVCPTCWLTQPCDCEEDR